MKYIQLENISKSYDKEIIKDINIDIEKGQIVSILGKSGIGKTTIFNILAGFEQADMGKILLNGKDITYNKKNVSYMMQKPLLMPYFNVLDNVCLYFKIKNMPKSKAYEKAIPIIEKFGLKEHMYKYPYELSAGMKQRVSFIRAYLKPSDLMLFDEPFSALDSFTKKKLYDWFKDIVKKEQKTSMLITHDINEAIYISDKIYVLDKKPANIVLSLDIEDIKDLEMSPKFLEYYKKIVSVF